VTKFTRHLTLMNAPRADVMSPQELDRVLAQLGLSYDQAGEFLGLVEPRNVRRWANGEHPVKPTAARFLRFLARAGLATPSVRGDVMPREELERILRQLKLSQSAAGRLLGVDERNVRRWLAGEYPVFPPAARFLRFLVGAKISPITVMETLAQ
jgi:DNA-binding transcriptional regulator YiaG